MALRIERERHAAEERAASLKARIPELVRWLCARGATEVYLFGSLATGKEPHATTDVDLAVRGLSESDVGDALLDLEPRLGTRLDIVRLEAASPTMLECIFEDGMRVDRVSG